jgi:hypothetical protein
VIVSCSAPPQKQEAHMTGKQWKRLLAQFNPPLSQHRAAEMFDYDGRTGARWASENPRDATEVPKAVRICTQLMLLTDCTEPEELLLRAKTNQWQ